MVDPDQVDHVALHGVFAASFAAGAEAPRPPHDRVPYVAGLENPVENFPNITGWLVKHGYSDDDIKKVVGGNVLRVLEKVWWR
ncbi:MAG TPA: membrane dipeptidase [Trebonia sp.]|nr:membrane dipeptidase [Trebonia sp.]